ncbi:MAG: peptide deformylase [Candidatus Aminicenantes bacterium 4484_214]|nr:MAG: peptide deformylase [Candidatus Aminicenantes bacterium 4484_214]
MAKRLEIVTVPHQVLHQQAREIRDINHQIVELAKNMVETMYAAPGIGLAAPQVNQSLRLITVDLSVGEKPDQLIILINPQIKEMEGEDIDEEGCLSVPEIHEKVKRPLRVLVSGYTLEGKERTIEAEGLSARVFCHEIDHLNGILFIDRLSPLKRSLIRKKLRKHLVS